MPLLAPEQTCQIIRRIVDTEYLDELLDVLCAEISALHVADGFLVNMLDAGGDQLVCRKLRYPAEFQNLEQTYLGYKIPLDNGHINARAMITNEIVRVDAANADPDEKSILAGWKIREMCALPLRGKSDAPPVGVLLLLRREGTMAQHDVERVAELLDLFGHSVARWQRLAQLEQLHEAATAAVAENQRLLEFLDDMTNLTSPDKIYALFAAELFRQLPFDLATFFLIEDDKLQISKSISNGDKYSAACQQWEAHHVRHPYPLEQHVSGLVFATQRNEAMLFPDYQAITHLPLPGLDKATLALLGTPRTIYVSPIRHHNRPIGAFALYSLEHVVELGDADQHLLEQLCSFLGTAIANSKLYATSQAQILEIRHLNEMLEDKVAALATQASTDQLTGLYNFRSFEEELDRRLLDLRRTGEVDDLALVLIDIDHFKPFNDTNGHAAGNDVLAGVAQEIAGHVRQSDKACRYGGEEFVLVLPNCGIDGATMLAERIRQSIGERVFDTCVGPRTVTISAGCAAYCSGDDRESLFRRADLALYQAKEGGRDRVCVA